jgi:hypothetical protein
VRARIPFAAAFAALAVSALPAPSVAFVPPTYRARRVDHRHALLGKWRLFSQKSVAKPPDTVLTIDGSTLTVSREGTNEVFSWEILEDDEDGLTLGVHQNDEKVGDVDVLLDGQDLMTIYVTADDAAFEEVLRFERVP